ncbi:MAG TPA: hypothetical protein VG652_11685 [Gaiellaceae bacterium]|nr:hypothetical protein [Gaiellaceae bacterium]
MIAAGAVTASATAGLGQSASGTISSSHAGTRPVTLTLKLGYEMQCGYPGPGPVVVTFPASWRLPAKLGPTPALVDGKAAVSASISGHTVKIGLAAPPQIMCDVIGPGTLTVQFTRGDHIGAPLKAGASVVTATVKNQTFQVPYSFTA